MMGVSSWFYDIPRVSIDLPSEFQTILPEVDDRSITLTQCIHGRRPRKDVEGR
jgi:hypothetical protein